mgnify:CR=1 FL=1
MDSPARAPGHLDLVEVLGQVGDIEELDATTLLSGRAITDLIGQIPIGGT